MTNVFGECDVPVCCMGFDVVWGIVVCDMGGILWCVMCRSVILLLEGGMLCGVMLLGC